jgi:UDP-N-acetylmuramoyl-tripeptide--D-alanyl-D-alanine ligase
VSLLWTSAEIEAATGGRASASFEVSGVTFDSREVQPGDLFVAMPARSHDGHKFVAGAFAAGRAGRSSRTGRRPARPCRGHRTRPRSLGRAARERSQGADRRSHRLGRQDQHQGSALRALDRVSGGKAHRSVKSYNNHTASR